MKKIGKHFCLGWLGIMLLWGCGNNKKLTANMNTIDLFRTIITGDFDNSRQVADEVAAGKQVHPLAKHVNRVADDKITGLPMTNAKFDFWIIEESYYEYPGKPMEAKPYLFNFSQGPRGSVLLKVYQFPPGLKKEDIKNNNPALRLALKDLKPSPTFKGAVYTFHPETETFTTDTPNDLGNGMTFTLTETLSKTQLVVMELLVKDGKRLTPYDTPIVYDRK
jgi:hypothetical protein